MASEEHELRNLSMPSIVFVCVANSFRSQMAEALAKRLSEGRWEVWSAGSHPSGRLHPLAVQLMEEIGLDLRAHRSKGLEELPSQVWDYVVTMGCGDACPTLIGRHRLDWAIPDPAGLPHERTTSSLSRGLPIEESRRIRDRLDGLIRALIHGHPSSATSAS